MEHESFENPDIAAILNEHFVAIKVDREERPDVDRIYMTSLQAMGQNGGWPMSMFLTPDLRPFYGGTYYPVEPVRPCRVSRRAPPHPRCMDQGTRQGHGVRRNALKVPRRCCRRHGGSRRGCGTVAGSSQ